MPELWLTPLLLKEKQQKETVSCADKSLYADIYMVYMCVCVHTLLCVTLLLVTPCFEGIFHARITGMDCALLSGNCNSLHKMCILGCVRLFSISSARVWQVEKSRG